MTRRHISLLADGSSPFFGPIWHKGQGRALLKSAGDVTAPVITSASSGNCAENATLSHALTADEPVTWSLVGGADQARFELAGSVLRWASDGTKDYETPNDADTNNTYVVTVRATDLAANTTDQTVTITVTDVDDTAPTITSSSSPSVNDSAALAHSLTANESVTWSLVGGADQALFEISGSTLRWLSDGTRNYFSPADANADNVYAVTVRATDLASNTSDQTINVTVANNSTNFVLVARTTGASESFTIPCQNVGTFNATVDWGDAGATSAITTYNDADLAHTYASAGDHVIRISGTFPNIKFNNAGDKTKVIKVLQLGSVGWAALDGAFYGCSALTTFYSATCTTTANTSLINAWRGCSALVNFNISSMSTTNVTNAHDAFNGCTALVTIDLSGLDLAKVTSFVNMFTSCNHATTINLTGVSTAAATNMASMFLNCTALVSLIGNASLNLAKVTDVSSMFNNDAALVGLDPSGWDVAKVTTGANCLSAGPTLTTAVYDATLIAWSALAVQSSVPFHFGASKYTAGGAAAAARLTLTGTKLWTITDGGTA